MDQRPTAIEPELLSAKEERETPATHHFEYICDRCGATMIERNCKIICQNCGHRFDCSDLNIYFD